MTSATIDGARSLPSAMRRWWRWKNAPIGGTARWRPPPETRQTTLVEQIVAAADDITRADRAATCWCSCRGREIRRAHLALAQRQYRRRPRCCCRCYARLSADQDRVFQPGPQRQLGFNVAGASLTVPRIRYVIDTGGA